MHDFGTQKNAIYRSSCVGACGCAIYMHDQILKCESCGSNIYYILTVKETCTDMQDMNFCVTLCFIAIYIPSIRIVLVKWE